MNVFELFGTIAINNEQANKALSDTGKQADGLSNTMEAAFSKMQSTAKQIGTAIAAVFTVDQIKDFGQSCAEVYASVAAEESAFAQIMGDYAEMATEKMNKVAESTGVVSTRLTPYMTSMTAKFKGLGFQVDEATSLATEGLFIASDAAAFWDKSLDEAMSHLNSFINGSYEGGEAIGIFANDTQMAAYALEKGIVAETKAWSSLDEATKQSTRMRYAKEMMATSGATGQAAIESESYANVQANLNEQMRQFQKVIGEPIMNNIMLPAMRRMSQLMPIVTEKTEKFINGFTTGLGKIAGRLKNGFNPAELANKVSEMFESAKMKASVKLTQFGDTISATWSETVWPEVQKYFKAELGIEVPEWSEVETTVTSWWTDTAKPALEQKFKATFGIDPPNWSTLPSTIQGWWTGTAKPKIEETAKAIMSITPPDLAGLMDEIDLGWKDFITPTLTGLLTGNFLTITPLIGFGLAGLITSNWSTHIAPLLDGFLNQELAIDLPDFAKLAGDIISEWDTYVSPDVNELFTTLGGKLYEALGIGGEALTNVATGIKEFGTWCVENKDTIYEFFGIMGEEAAMAAEGSVSAFSLLMQSFRGLADLAIDSLTDSLKWMLENGEKTAKIIEAVAIAFAVGAIAAHPYAAAIMAVVAGLGLLRDHENQLESGKVFDEYSQEDLKTLQEYVDAMRAANEAEQAMIDSGYDYDATERFHAANDAKEAAEARVKAIEGLMNTYTEYAKYHGYGKGSDIWIDVPIRAAEDTEDGIQGELDSMTFESDVSMNADMSQIQSALNSTGFTASATMLPVMGNYFGSSFSTNGVDGSHAGGLDSVPFDGYIARLHKGEAVLNSTNAQAWRSGGMSSGDIGRLETAINNMAVMMQQLVNNSRSGQQIVLDSGVLVGQLAPALDTQLGAISSRKGRRN